MEKAEYDLHRNDPHSPGYRRFLSRLFDPMAARIKACSRGLDFGCGPGPALSMMFEDAGHPMARFDPFYAPDPSVLTRPYEFITASEVVEHLRSPADELSRLWKLLPVGGHLGLMTKLVKSHEAFKKWHYIQDPTHVCFYSRPTFLWQAHRWGAAVEFIGDDVIIFRKKRATS